MPQVLKLPDCPDCGDNNTQQMYTTGMDLQLAYDKVLCVVCDACGYFIPFEVQEN